MLLSKKNKINIYQKTCSALIILRYYCTLRWMRYNLEEQAFGPCPLKVSASSIFGSWMQKRGPSTKFRSNKKTFSIFLYFATLHTALTRTERFLRLPHLTLSSNPHLECGPHFWFTAQACLHPLGVDLDSCTWTIWVNSLNCNIKSKK